MHYVDKKTDMSKFTSLRYGGDAFFQISKNSAPTLYALAEEFPHVMGEALKMLGGHTRKRLKKIVEQGGTTAHKWLRISDLHRYRHFDRLKAGEFPRSSYKGVKTHKSQNTFGNLFARSKTKPSSLGFFGKAVRAIAFHKHSHKNLVEIGALSPSAALFMEAVQGGRRGNKGAFQFTGRQQVTPAMRRALWAAGFPLSKETMFIGQEPRPLIAPAFKEMSPEFEVYLVRRITEILARKGIEWV